MEQIRKPFQGVLNIIRFNKHFYIISIAFLLLAFFFGSFLGNASIYIDILAYLAALATLLSLLVSCYVYDVSGLYKLEFLKPFINGYYNKVVNIHAGFDETSALLKQKVLHSELQVLDFYNPLLHTEVSIKRARKAYPAFPGTVAIATNKIPLAKNSTDLIFLIFAAHEIRNEAERISFFESLKNALTTEGKIIVVEHLRDIPNFLAYNIGFFHFHAKSTWLRTFNQSGLNLEQEFKFTPFISTFILSKNGNTP